jgi:hypothetical protein
MRTFLTSVLAVVAAILVGAFAGAAVALTLSTPGYRPNASELEAFLFIGVLVSGIALGLWRRASLPSTWLSVAAISLAIVGGAALFDPATLNLWRVLYAMLVLVLPLALGLILTTVSIHFQLFGRTHHRQNA